MKDSQKNNGVSCTGLEGLISLEFQFVTGFFGLEKGRQISLTSYFNSYQALKLLNRMGPFLLFPRKDTATNLRINNSFLVKLFIYLRNEIVPKAVVYLNDISVI